MSGRVVLAVFVGICCFIVIYGIEVFIAWLVRGHLSERFAFEIILGFPALLGAILAGVKVNSSGYRENKES